jgi:hypothetical protein
VVSSLSNLKEGVMRGRLQSYTAYTIGCALTWAVILGTLGLLGEKDRLHRILPVVGGWWMGWASATVARYGYPPPRSRPPWVRARSA